MAWGQKIGKGLIFILLVLFFISCKTQHTTGVALYEPSLDSLTLSKIQQDFESDTITLAFDDFKLSKFAIPLSEFELERPAITELNIDSNIIDPINNRLTDITFRNTQLSSDSLMFYKEQYSSDTIVNIDTTMRLESLVFHFPEPYMESDSIVNSVSNSIADSLVYKDSVNYHRNFVGLTEEDVKPLRDSISLVLASLEELKMSLMTVRINVDKDTIPIVDTAEIQKSDSSIETSTSLVQEVSPVVTSSVDTVVMIDKTLQVNSNHSNLQDSLQIILDELRSTKAELNRQRTLLNASQNNSRMLERYYSTTQSHTKYVSVPVAGSSNKDTVFMTESHHYYNSANDLLKDSLSLLKDSIQASMYNSDNDTQRVIYDTIYIVKQVDASVLPVDTNGNVTHKLQTVISQKENRIKHLRDSLTLLNNRLVLASNTKQVDTVVVEKEKRYSDTVLVNVPQKAINPFDTLSYVAYYSINQVRARDIESLLEAIKQVKLTTVQRVYLSGYTDATGSSEYNKIITDQRLTEMRQRIVGLGISDHIIFVQNFANRYASDSVVDHDRRLEIKLILESKK